MKQQIETSKENNYMTTLSSVGLVELLEGDLIPISSS